MGGSRLQALGLRGLGLRGLRGIGPCKSQRPSPRILSPEISDDPSTKSAKGAGLPKPQKCIEMQPLIGAGPLLFLFFCGGGGGGGFGIDRHLAVLVQRLSACGCGFLLRGLLVCGFCGGLIPLSDLWLELQQASNGSLGATKLRRSVLHSRAPFDFPCGAFSGPQRGTKPAASKPLNSQL